MAQIKLPMMMQYTGGMVLKQACIPHSDALLFFFLEFKLSFCCPGNYTETLNDAEIATGLQPSFLKVFIRGEFGLSWERPSLTKLAREVVFDKKIRKPILQNVLVF